MILFLNIFITVLTTFDFHEGNAAQRLHKKHPMLDGKIVGGVNVTIEQYPYQVSLTLFGRHFCGGSLLKPDVVLTAAHCIKRIHLLHKIRAGSTSHKQHGIVVGVKTIHRHPKYVNYDYDVAILILRKRLTLSSKIQLIQLQETESDIPDGKMGTVTGWGKVKESGAKSNILQAVDVPKFNTTSCKKLYNNIITDRMLCFGYEEGSKDACQGDSGGPLLLEIKDKRLDLETLKAACWVFTGSK